MDTTQRFSKRVENYLKYRPHYPAEILEGLRADFQLTPATVVADIGSGTGFLTEVFLRHGQPVYGVEPNAEMRAAGEQYLQGYPRFCSVAGTAEATTLPAASVDGVVAGQAFHWFDRARARAEFQRILRPGGWVALIWNDRQTEATPFLRAYEQFLRARMVDYAQVEHKQAVNDAGLREFFGPAGWICRRYACQWQAVDYAGLLGRLLSASYAPLPDDPRHPAMLAALREVFDAHQLDGQVQLGYVPRLYSGRLS